MRIRGYDEETEELSEDLQNISGDIADLTKVAGKGGISLFTDSSKTTYKSTYQILKEIAAIYHDLTDKQQADLLEKLAGKRGAQVLAGLLDDFSSVEDALKTMDEAAGSSDREMGVIESSLEYKINRLKETWVGIAQDLIDRGTVGGIIDFLTNVSDLLGGIISNMGLLKTAAMGIGAVVGFKKGNIFGYDPEQGFTIKGAEGGLFNNVNKEILSQGQNQEFLKQASSNAVELKDIDLLAQGFANLDKDVVQFAKDAKMAGAATGDLVKEFNSMGSPLAKLGNGVKNLGGQLLSTFANAAVSAGIGWLVGTGLNLLTNVISDLYNEILTNNAELQRQATSIQNLSNNIEDHNNEIKSLDESIAKYEELREKMKDTELTTTELLGVKEQMLDLQNSVVDAYGDEASSIDFVNGKYEDQLALLEAIRKQKARDFLYGSEGAMNADKKGKSDYERNLDYINARVGNDYTEYQHGVLLGNLVNGETVKSKFGFDYDELLAKYSALSLKRIEQNGVISVSLEIDPNVKKKEASEQLAQFYEELDRIAATNPKVKEYKDKLTSDIDLNFDLNKYNVALENVKNVMQNSMILDSENGLTVIDQLDQAVKEYNSALMAFETETTDDTTKQLEDAKLKLDDATEKARNYQNPNFTAEGYELYQQYVDDSVAKIQADADERLRKYFESDPDSLHKAKILSNVYEKRKELDPDAIKIFDESLMSHEAEVLTLEDIDGLAKEAQDEANKKPIELKVKASDSVKALSIGESALSSLSDLYDQTVTQTASAGHKTGFADASTLESVKSAFGSFYNALNDEGNTAGAKQVAQAIEELDRVMIESPGDAAAAEQAINKLTTAYIDQSGILDGLTKENADYYEGLLEAKGITNAHDVVVSRLTKDTRNLMKSTAGLAQAFEQYGDAIKNGKNDQNYDNQIQYLQTALHNMFTFTDGFGKEFSIDFNPDFIIENLDLIKKAATGDVEALEELRLQAAKDYIINADVGISPERIMGLQDQINDLISQYDINDVTVDGFLNDQGLINGLNNFLAQSNLTARQASAILSTIGVEPTYELVKMPVTVEESDGFLTRLFKTFKANIGVPSIKYRVATSGAGATYKPTNSNNKGSGGSGGDGSSKSSEPNKPKEEAAETFDWLEVYIKRIQEAEESLDKTVNNTYKNWSTRNKALTKEIKETSKEIDAQRYAEQRYKDYAETIQINDGKGLNDDDYGENDSLIRDADQKALNEAKANWEKYKKLVREGKMGADDIEKIQNKYLKDKIQEYQQWIEKSIAAGKALEDAEIKQSNNMKRRFDNLKTKYEQLITLIQDRADVINAKIERTQAKGFFVSNSYYKQLIKNEEKQIGKMEKERDALIKARDNGLKSGAWDKASEEYRNMTHEINALTTSIENANNQTIEWQNTMRQNNWDKFDWMEQRIERIKTEAQGLIDLMSNDKLYEDDGRLTDKGMASLGMIAVQYQTNERQIAHYRSELKKLSDQIKGDPSNKDLIARYDELADKTNELVSSNEQLKDSWKSMVETGIQTHLSNLDKIIEKYQEITDAEKEMYDYQKNISKQVKNINELERMLTIYSGDDSEESRKNRQQLQTQLEDARKALQETEWDKAINESKKLVSQMREDYEEFLNKRLDDIDALMEYGIGEAKKNTDAIVETLKAEAEKTGFVITPELQAVFDNTDEKNLLGATNEAVKDIKDYVGKMADKEDMDSRENFKSEEEKAYEAFRDQSKTYNDKRWEDVESSTEKIKKNVEALNNVKTEAGRQKKQESINKSEATAYEKLDKLQTNYQTQLEKLHALEDQGVNVDDELKEVEKLLTDVYNARAYIFNLLNSGKGGIQMGYMGYAKGSREIKHDQLAWTQEEGQELIFRSSDGAMLTPLGAGDMVFTNDMTKKLFDFAKGDLPVLNMPKVPSTAGNNINNNNAISITLPNVQNYEQFKSEMKKDTRLQSWMQEITLGQAIGKNTLRRNSL